MARPAAGASSASATSQRRSPTTATRRPPQERGAQPCSGAMALLGPAGTMRGSVRPPIAGHRRELRAGRRRRAPHSLAQDRWQGRARGQSESGECGLSARVADVGNTQVATKWHHAAAHRSDGSAGAWGGNEERLCDLPAPVADVCCAQSLPERATQPGSAVKAVLRPAVGASSASATFQRPSSSTRRTGRRQSTTRSFAQE